jgi:hypothetical protein
MRLLILLALALAGAVGNAVGTEVPAEAPALRGLMVSGQDAEGRVWGVGRDTRYREILVRWEDGAWRKVVADIEWPGSSWAELRDEAGRFRRISSHGPRSGVVALTVAPDGAVWSWWEAKHEMKDDEPAQASDEGPSVSASPKAARLKSRLHAYRHSLDKPWELMGSWLRKGPRPAFSRGRGGPVGNWEAMPIRRLFHTGPKLWALCADDQRADGAVLWELDPGSEEGAAHALPIPAGATFATPRIAIDAWERVWLWAETIENLGPGSSPRLFVRFENGVFDPAPVIKGLPEGEITAFELDVSRRSAVAAMRGAGLWRIDLVTLHAEPRNSPPRERLGRVWKLQTWPDGLEAALAGDDEEARWENHVNHWGRLWIRTPGAEVWTERGRVRVENWQGSALRPMPMRELRWHRHDDHLFLTGARRVWVWRLDGAEPFQPPRPLDWSIGAETWGSGAAYPLGNDGLLLASWNETGSAPTQWLPPGRVAALMRREPSPIRRIDNATLGDDGAIWSVRAAGPRTSELLRWKDGVWRSWPKPGDEGSGREFALDTLGRAWIYSSADEPAWVLAPEPPGAGWVEHASLRRLIEETLAARPGLRLLPTRQSEGLRLPVWNAGGVALVWEKGNEFHLWREGRWTPLDGPTESSMHGPVDMGLDEKGRPWVSTSLSTERNRRWMLDSAGAWTPGGEVESRYARIVAEEAARPAAPEWFTEAPEVKTAGPTMAWAVDSSGAWWCFPLNRRPLRGRDGRIWPATREDVPDPWRAGLNIHTVQRVDIGGDGSARIWSHDLVTVVPAAALAEPPGPVESPPVGGTR